MNTQTQGDLFSMLRAQDARDARDAGIKQAIDHADAVTPNCSTHAFKHLMDFVCPLPTGAIMLRAARSGLLRKNGYTTALDPKLHCNPVTQWVRA